MITKNKKVQKFLVFDYQDKVKNSLNFFEMAKKNSVKKGQSKENLALDIDKILYGYGKE